MLRYARKGVMRTGGGGEGQVAIVADFKLFPMSGIMATPLLPYLERRKKKYENTYFCFRCPLKYLSGGRSQNFEDMSVIIMRYFFTLSLSTLHIIIYLYVDPLNIRFVVQG